MAGIYIHIPFCKQKCSYCDFHFSTTFASYRDRMIASIVKEIETRKEYLERKSLRSIYFGGGTPSLLSRDELKQILDTIYSNFKVEDDVEVTLEANPDDCTESNLQFWKQVGVNRLSIGLQSFKAYDLEWMNRAHSVEESHLSVERALKTGFENITIDLMYGLPNLSDEEWKAHIQRVIDWGIPHISSYCLTVEKGTALNNWVERKKIAVGEEEQQSRQFEILVEMLENAGIYQYEISNFSQEGFESRHNSNYWKGAWYLGVGPSAHSFNGASRQCNITNNHAYMNQMEAGEDYFEVEVLTKEDQFNELILTGLRTVYGVSLEKLNELVPISTAARVKIAEFKDLNWMLEQNGTLTLTKEGRLRADYIASELFVSA